MALLRSVIGRKKNHATLLTNQMSNQNQSRLDHSRFPVFLTFFFLFLFFLFFFWVSSYLASCEELLLVPKNTKKLFQTITCALQTNSMHCQKSEIVSHQRALKSSRIILFPLVFFRKTLRIGADGTSERERTRGLRREKERRTARFVVTLSQTPPIFSHPSFARLY